MFECGAARLPPHAPSVDLQFVSSHEKTIMTQWTAEISLNCTRGACGKGSR